MLVDRTILYCDGGRELVIAVLKACNYYIGHSTLVGQCLMKSLWSTCLSIRPSLTFLKIESLVFAFIVYNDSWPWYLVTAEARFLKKKIDIWQLEFGPNGPKSDSILGFLTIFSSFVHWFSLELHGMIASVMYNM